MEQENGVNSDPKPTIPAKSYTRKYRVRAGDTLSGIAQKYHTSVAKIKKTNGLRSDRIQIGQVLKIP
jgi:LysM repeat protein